MVRIGPVPIIPASYATVADHLLVEIVGQQLSKAAATTIWGRVVVAAHDRGVTVAELLMPGGEGIVQGCGVSRGKVKALQAVVQAERDGLLGADLGMMGHAERSARLTGIWGVGQWTADMIGIFHFLDHDIWPLGDVAATGSLRLLTGQADTARVADTFAPLRSILARYAWRIRDTPRERAQDGNSPEPSVQGLVNRTANRRLPAESGAAIQSEPAATKAKEITVKPIRARRSPPTTRRP
jgi:DNA-3-methyladenine glycosylase II